MVQMVLGERGGGDEEERRNGDVMSSCRFYRCCCTASFLVALSSAAPASSAAKQVAHELPATAAVAAATHVAAKERVKSVYVHGMSPRHGIVMSLAVVDVDQWQD